jgi:hypothetical protein
MNARASLKLLFALSMSTLAWSGASVHAAPKDELAELKAELAKVKQDLADQKSKLDGIAAKTTETSVVETLAQTTPAPQPTSSAEIDALKAEIATLKAAQAAAEEARSNEELERITAAAAEAEKPSLKLYGFLDTGFNKMFLKDDNPTRGIYLRQGDFTFVPGSINLYLDAKSGKGFRALIETRNTFYPSGELVSNGNGTLKPTDTRVYDQFSPSSYNKVPWGGILIERAHIDWEAQPWLTLRVGYFLTPYGIWNVDHGTPTLISIILPQFQILEAIPQRQTGVQALGEFSLAPYALGYRLYVTNGRSFQLASPPDENGYGGRLYLRRSGDAVMTLGSSFYTGTFSDKVVNMQLDAAAQSVSFVASHTYEAREWALGGDFALDYGAFRARTEILVRQVKFRDGMHQPTSDPTKFQPNHRELYSYVLASYRLFSFFEPFVYAEAKYNDPNYETDMVHGYSGGLNLYFTPTAMLKTQYAYYAFKNRTGPSIANQNMGALVSRFIYVF